MRDNFGREIDYLRISVTDLCNLRCRYCMPPEGVKKQSHRDILSLEEIEEIARAAVSLGVKKLRLTGGEPLLRRGIVELCEKLSAIPGVEELALTTNAVRLTELAKPLKAAGVQRVNISLDTLNAEKYRAITRCGDIEGAFAGIRAAAEAGLTPLKINTVLIGGFNDDEIPALTDLTKEYPIELRFIELMPIGDAAPFPGAAYLPCSVVPERCSGLVPIESGRGVAARYRFPGAPGTVGLIRPLSCSFCPDCSRLRLTADGYLKPCLHSKEEIPLRGLHGDALTERIREAILQKPKEHGVLSADSRSETIRSMNAIGG